MLDGQSVRVGGVDGGDHVEVNGGPSGRDEGGEEIGGGGREGGVTRWSWRERGEKDGGEKVSGGEGRRDWN